MDDSMQTAARLANTLVASMPSSKHPCVLLLPNQSATNAERSRCIAQDQNAANTFSDTLPIATPINAPASTSLG